MVLRAKALSDHEHDGGHNHAPIDIPALLKHVVNRDEKFTPEDDIAMKSPQRPDIFLICCIDSRFQPDKALDYGPGVALEYRPISAVIPPAAEADQALLSRMAFRRLKDVRNIVLIAHSDCGGAQAAIQIPNPDMKNGGDLDIVAGEAHRTGLDVPSLSAAFLKAAGGDVKEAGNMLAKEISVQSMKNILGYKGRDGFATIEDEIKSGETNVILLYYDLEKHAVEKYDLAAKAWEPVSGYQPKPAVPMTPPAPPPAAPHP